MINIENISKSFGKKQVLKNVSLSIEKGKAYGIVGNNGAGKTTLFRCIAGIDKHAGQIETHFHPLKNYLGLLETNPTFMSRITGWEYLKLVCTAREINREDFEQQNIFDLPLNQYCEMYSTGMKKKLAFMGIILQKNEVFILDEPFSGVDIQSNILIAELIQELKRRNKTILISSHVFSTLSALCDQIFVLKSGEIEYIVDPENYHTLEEDMKSQVLGDRIKKIDM